MLKKIEEIKNYMFVEVSDMITKEDVESVIPALDNIIDKHEKIKCLVLLNEVKGYTFGGFIADFNYYLKNKSAFDSVAIVGDKEFEKGMVQIFDKLMPGKAKYFDISELEKAKEWIEKQ